MSDKYPFVNITRAEYERAQAEGETDPEVSYDQWEEQRAEAEFWARERRGW